FIDPDGREPQSPIFDQFGNFLGVDSEGFKGDIVIMRAAAYNSLTNFGTKVLDHSTTKAILGKGNSFIAQTLDSYIANDYDLASSADKTFVEKIFTNLINAAHADGLIDISSADLDGGKIHVDNDTDYPGGAA
ncbi:hypothetical protein RZS08_45135, partial [Arthrospira platensis SPKY1]|nr:hypothetical protein [Arthrospira platensis SPKY1]